MQQVVITAVGPDRPGLVDELSGKLLAAGANIADSRMVNLRGQFALLLLAETAADKLAAVEEAARAAGQATGLSVNVTPQAEADAVTAGAASLPFTLSVHAMDRPGIVHQIAHLLHDLGVNIEELQTELQPGPYSSSPVFGMTLAMNVPATVAVAKLRRELAALCETMNCDFELVAGQ